jgi:hypothetical protein
MERGSCGAFSYLLANKTTLVVGREVDTSDFHVKAIDLLGNRVEAEIGSRHSVQDRFEPRQYNSRTKTEIFR